LAGLVFAIHPVNVATVGWVSEQKTTLSMLLYAVTILLYLKFDDEQRWGWYGLSLAAFLLALLSKTAVVMVPVVLLGCIWWRHGSIRGKDVARSLPFFACSLILGLVTVWFQYHRAMGGTTIRTDNFLSRLVTAGWVPWFYLYKAFLPVDLTVIYPQWHVDATRWISYVPGMALVGCFVLFWWKRETWGRPWLFGLGYFVVTLFPVLGFFDQSFHQYSLVADHWQYYSIVGVIALAVAGGVAICRRIGKRGQYVGVLVSVAVLVTLGAATWTRARVYADSQTLWRDNVAKNPNAWGARCNLGAALILLGRPQEAIFHLEQALRVRPDYAEAQNSLGLALWQTGKEQEAIGHYEQALRLKPDYAEAHCNLGAALGQAGRIPEAIEHLEHALRIQPDHAGAHNNLALALRQVGKLDEAIAHYEQALRIKPDYAEAHNNLGLALSQTGQVQEAIGHWEQALRIKPDFAIAHYNLGVVLEQAGRVREAIGHYEQALRIRPDFTQAQNALAQLRAGQ
jgi:tetratricopeptide (TPR) repeat protein